jgi:two-component system chemotaxis response regulator CheB
MNMLGSIPGNLLVQQRPANYTTDLTNGARSKSERPSPRTCSACSISFGGFVKDPNAKGIIITKVGADGAGGTLKMKKAGPGLIAQDENNSVAFDPPKEAIKIRAVDRIVPITEFSRRSFR